MGLENYTQLDRQIDRSQNKFEHPIIRRMHELATKVLSEEAVDPREFAELYGEQNINKDLAKTEDLKSKFEIDESKPAADVFEALVYRHVELSNWLGPNAETIRTSEYDDIYNKVDLVVQFNEENSTKYLALGVDITFGSRTMEKKFDEIKKKIEDDKLTQVKYFKTHGYTGRLEHLPHIVIGVDIDKVIALAGHWERKENKELAEHVSKDVIMQEILAQLPTYLKYAEACGAKNAVRSFAQVLNTIQKINTPENGFAHDKTRMDKVKEDKVFQSILKNLDKFKQLSH